MITIGWFLIIGAISTIWLCTLVWVITRWVDDGIWWPALLFTMLHLIVGCAMVVLGQ